jgi:hypothetical protein
MYRYTFHDNAEAPAWRASTDRTLYRDVAEVAGRNPIASYPSVRRALDRNGRIYIAAARGFRSIVIRRHRIEPGECEFCHGLPVRNGAAWVDPNAPTFAPCPRCGK